MRVLDSLRRRRSDDDIRRTKAVREFCRNGHDLRRPIRLILIALRVGFLRWRLDRLLQACRRAKWRPGRNRSRPRCPATGLLLILGAWPAAGGHSPEIQAMAPPLLKASAVLAILVIPAPSLVAPAPQHVPPASAADFVRGNRSIPEITLTFDGHDGARAAGEIRAWAAARGHRPIGWTRGTGTAEDLDARDWVADTSSRIYRSRDEIVTRILDFGDEGPGALNGGIILIHLDTHRQADRFHEALPSLLKCLQDRRYRLVTVSELLAHAAQRHGDVTSSAAPRLSVEVQPSIW